MALTLYTYMPNYRAWKALIAAAYNDLKIDVPEFHLHKDNQTPEFLAKNPLGKVPVLDTPHGAIFESNAIARYVARLRQDTNLYGSSFFESAQVDQWIDFSANELEPTRAIWLFPILGFMQFDQEAYESAKADIQKTLQVLEKHLATRTFLVGNSVTLADIVVVSALVDLYKRVFAPEFRKPFVNVNRWFQTCINQPQFAKVIGKVDLAASEEVASGAGKQQKGGKQQQQQKQEQKKEQKQEQKPKEKAAPAKKADDEDDTPKEEKKKNPLDALAASSMNLDATKKLFFEKRPDFASFFTEFWNFFDNNGYSIWTADYQYNNENTVYFMTANLMTGFIQRLDEYRKYGFGALSLQGKDEDTAPFTVSGVFIWRGTEFPPTLKEDVADTEYYTWKKVDTKDAAQRKIVEDRFYADSYDGLQVLERKYYK